MKLRINGEETQATSTNVAALLRELGYREAIGAQSVAVALNQTCVRRKDYDGTLLKDGDEVEILAPMAGG